MQRTCRCWSQSANSSLFCSIGLGDKAVTSSDHWVWQQTFVFHSPTIHNMKVTSESTFSKTTTKSRRGKEGYMSLFFCECSPWWINERTCSKYESFVLHMFRIAGDLPHPYGLKIARACSNDCVVFVLEML